MVLKLAAFLLGVVVLLRAKRALRARVNLDFLSSSEEEDEEVEVSESDSPSYTIGPLNVEGSLLAGGLPRLGATLGGTLPAPPSGVDLAELSDIRDNISGVEEGVETSRATSGVLPDLGVGIREVCCRGGGV